MNSYGFIYIRHHLYYENDKICKLGKTKNILDRDNNYATGEYIRGYFVLVIEILDKQIYDDTYVEKLLQKYFKNYHIKKDGGCEFYQNKIIDEIIPFLKKTGFALRYFLYFFINTYVIYIKTRITINPRILINVLLSVIKSNTE